MPLHRIWAMQKSYNRSVIAAWATLLLPRWLYSVEEHCSVSWLVMMVKLDYVIFSKSHESVPISLVTCISIPLDILREVVLRCAATSGQENMRNNFRWIISCRPRLSPNLVSSSYKQRRHRAFMASFAAGMLTNETFTTFADFERHALRLASEKLVMLQERLS